jgi:hypothetical protein
MTSFCRIVFTWCGRVAAQQPGFSDIPPIAHPTVVEVVDAAGGAIIVGAPTGAMVGWVGAAMVESTDDVPASEFGAVTVVIGLTPALPIS